MTALSIALVLIFILWLIDKNHVWRGAAKVALAGFVLAVLGVSSFYGWNKYQDRKQEAAERKKHAEDVAACMKRGTSVAADADTNLQAACERDSGTVFKAACWSKPDAKGFQYDLNSVTDNDGTPIPPKPNEVCYPVNFLPKLSESPNSPYSSTIPNPPDGFAVDDAICWKDQGGNLHYPKVISGGIDLTAGIVHSEQEQHHCSLLKAGETLVPGKK